MSRPSTEALRGALAHLTVLQQHATGDLSEQLVIDAVCMRLSAAIEALSQLEVADRDRIFGETWPLMWATRNRIAHGYLLIDSDIITATLDADVPMVIRTITRALNE